MIICEWIHPSGKTNCHLLSGNHLQRKKHFPANCHRCRNYLPCYLMRKMSEYRYQRKNHVIQRKNYFCRQRKKTILLPIADYYAKPMKRLPETLHYSDFCYCRYCHSVRLRKRKYDYLTMPLNGKQKQTKMSDHPILPYSENDYLAQQTTRLYGLTSCC